MKWKVLFLLHIFYFGFIKAIKIKNNNNSVTNSSKLLLSINFISNPHFFPDYGLNTRNEDPFGNLFTDNSFIPGEISYIGKNQIIETARGIDRICKSHGNINLRKDEILTVAIRLKRSIDAAMILNEELLRLNNAKFTGNNVLNFNFNYFNSTLKSGGYNKTYVSGNPLSFILNNPKFGLNLKQFDISDIFTFYIPSDYEKFTLLPLNIQLKNCEKLNQIFENNLGSNDIFKYINENMIEMTGFFKKNVKQGNFIRIENNASVNFLNFSDFNMKYLIEANSILTDYYINYQILNSNKKFPNEKLRNEINLFRNYDLYSIKNFNNDFIKAYSSGLLKYIYQLIYSKLSPNNDINSKLKLVNFVMNDYNIAGLYKAITLSSDTPSPNIKKYPQIHFGSRMTINLMQKELDNNDPDALTNSFLIRVLFEDNLVQQFKLSAFIQKLNEFIINDDSFYENLC